MAVFTREIATQNHTALGYKYDTKNYFVPTEKRQDYNESCLAVIEGPSEKYSKEEIYNYFTGLGGLHGLDYKDYGNYHSYGLAKKEFEQGQFFTPDSMCWWVMNCIRPNETDKVADITCGKGSFFNHCPNEENLYGCEIEENSFQVASYLFEKASIEQGDVRSYQPDTLMDIIVGNPPFNLSWEYEGHELSSQTGFFLKASELLYPGGIVAAIVPLSFLGQSTSTAEKHIIFDEFNHILEVALDDKLFHELGVTSFPTKLLILQKKASVLPDVPYNDETMEITDSNTIYWDYVHQAMERKRLASPHILLEVKGKEQTKRDLIYELKKKLYQIKVHPQSSVFYLECEDYVKRYLTQKCPPGMLYEVWLAEVAIKKRDVYKKLKKAFGYQNYVPEDRIALVKNETEIYYKGYSNQSAEEAKRKNSALGKIPIYEAVTSQSEELLDRCGAYKKLVQKKRRAFQNQTAYFHEMEPDPAVDQWLRNWELSDQWGEHKIKLNDMQRLDTALSLQKPYSYLQWEQGAGKTVSGVAQGQYRLEHGLTDYVFIVSSAISIEMTWAPFLKTYGIPHKVIRSKKDLRNVFPGDFVLITLGRVKNSKRWIKQVVRLVSKKLFLIYDEAHNSSTMESNANIGKITKAIFACFHRLKYKLLMSGTSISNNVTEVLPQLQLLYNSSHNMLSLCENVYRYSEKDDDYKSKENNQYGKPYPPYTQGLSLFRKSHLPKKLTVFGVIKTTPDIFNGEELRHICQYTMITRTFKEVTGKDIENISEITAVMTPPEQQLYEVAQKEFHRLEALYFKSTNMSVRTKAMSRAIAQINTMRSICACASVFPDYTGNGPTGKMTVIFNKIDRLPGKNIAIGLRDIKAVKEYARQASIRFPNRKVFTIIGGEMEPRKRKRFIDEEFSKYDDFILVCTQQSLSESVSIDSIDHCFIAAFHWNESKMSQFYRRFIRFFSTRQKYIYYVNYPDTIETNLIYLLVSKERMLQFLKGRDVLFAQLFEEMGFSLALHQKVMLKKQTDDGPELEWGKAEIREDVTIQQAA